MGIILMYAVNDKSSFQNLGKWLKDIQDYGDSDATIALIGNKCDIEQREVTYEEGKEIADNNGFIFFETSAKESVYVDELFHQLANIIKKKIFDANTLKE